MIYFICTIHLHIFHGNIWTQNWPAPNVSGFIAQLVEHRTGIARSRVQAPLKSWFFFRLLYAIVKIAIITARIILHLISYPQFTYDLFHMHHSLTYLSREHMNPKLTCSQRQWLHSSVGRASHRYREVTGSSPVEVLNFFQASLRNCKNCDHNCEDHSSFDIISLMCFLFIVDKERLQYLIYSNIQLSRVTIKIWYILVNLRLYWKKSDFTVNENDMWQWNLKFP